LDELHSRSQKQYRCFAYAPKQANGDGDHGSAPQDQQRIFAEEGNNRRRSKYRDTSSRRSFRWHDATHNFLRDL
jgi:hypothetical protein